MTHLIIEFCLAGLVGWYAYDRRDLKKQLYAALFPPRKERSIQLVGGPCDGRLVMVDEQAKWLTLPVMPRTELVAAWAGEAEAPLRPTRFVEAVYAVPAEMHYVKPIANEIV